MGIVQYAVIGGVCFSVIVNLLVLCELLLSHKERNRRKSLETVNALYDAETVRDARFVVGALETYPECYECRERIERAMGKRINRYRLTIE